MSHAPKDTAKEYASIHIIRQPTIELGQGEWVEFGFEIRSARTSTIQRGTIPYQAPQYSPPTDPTAYLEQIRKLVLLDPHLWQRELHMDKNDTLKFVSLVKRLPSQQGYGQHVTTLRETYYRKFS
jgi:hypothetical protein